MVRVDGITAAQNTRKAQASLFAAALTIRTLSTERSNLG